MDFRVNFPRSLPLFHILPSFCVHFFNPTPQGVCPMGLFNQYINPYTTDLTMDMVEIHQVQ